MRHGCHSVWQQLNVQVPSTNLVGAAAVGHAAVASTLPLGRTPTATGGGKSMIDLDTFGPADMLKLSRGLAMSGLGAGSMEGAAQQLASHMREELSDGGAPGCPLVRV